MTALVVKKLPVLATAPGGIQKLRELLWELAVSGRLLGEPTSGWQRLQLGNVGRWGSGGTPLKTHPEYYGGEIPWLVIGDLNDGVVKSAQQNITAAGLSNSSAKMVPVGTVLIAMYGSIGKLGIAGIRCATNQAIAHCQPDTSLVCASYLFVLLRSLRRDFLKRGQGLAQQNISQKILKEVEVSLPPIEEQKRIVAKVDELMALCNRLEARQQDAEAAHARLVQALLDSLTQARDADDFRASWQRLAGNFSDVLATDASMDAFRAAILELALQGRLAVRESAADWKLVKLGSVAKLINGDRGTNYPNRSEYVTEGIAFINTGHINPDGSLDLESMNYLTRKKFDSLRSGRIEPDDLVYCLRGATLGKTAFVRPFKEGAIASSLVILRFSAVVLPEFAYYFLISPQGRRWIRKFDNGSAQPNLAANSVKEYEMPLPSVGEQRQVVSRVTELLALCDQLKARIAAARAKHAQLAEALVEQAVA